MNRVWKLEQYKRVKLLFHWYSRRKIERDPFEAGWGEGAKKN